MNSERYYGQENPFTRPIFIKPSHLNLPPIGGHPPGGIRHFLAGGSPTQVDNNAPHFIDSNTVHAVPGQYLPMPAQGLSSLAGTSLANHGIPSGGLMNTPAAQAHSSFNPAGLSQAPNYAPVNLTQPQMQSFLGNQGVHTQNALQTPNFFPNRSQFNLPNAATPSSGAGSNPAPVPAPAPAPAATSLSQDEINQLLAQLQGKQEMDPYYNAIGGNKKGGSIADFAHANNFIPGGHVDDPFAGKKRDTVPAWLDSGEFVLDRNSVKGMGDGDQEVGISRLYDLQKHLQQKARRS